MLKQTDTFLSGFEERRAAAAAAAAADTPVLRQDTGAALEEVAAVGGGETKPSAVGAHSRQQLQVWLCRIMALIKMR